ncbi:MAG: quinolinate synthase NadA, partial [Gammaproteobacteria bacterium]|nr:quinolinate synthase NadA [Gammaproteobacteria bacterium]
MNTTAIKVAFDLPIKNRITPGEAWAKVHDEPTPLERAALKTEI